MDTGGGVQKAESETPAVDEAAGTRAGAPAASDAALSGGMAPMPKPPPEAKAAGGGGRSVMSLVWFFGVYFFFQWLLGRGGS